MDKPARDADLGRRTGRLFVLIFAALAVGIVSAGFLAFYKIEKHYRGEVERQLSAIAELKQDELVQWRKERLDDGHQFLKNSAFAGLVQRFFDKAGDVDAQRQLQAWLAQVQLYGQYDNLRLLDTGGVIRLSVPADRPPLAAKVLQHLPGVLRSGQVTLLDFYRNEHDQRVYLALMVPVLNERDGGRPLGVLVLHIDPENYLFPCIKRWPTPSRSAETLLVRREGSDVVYLNELRFQTNTALHLHAPLDNIFLPAAQAVLGRKGILEGLDYRGVPVLAALRPIPDAPWFMVNRMDSAEIYGPMREQLGLVVVMMALLLFGAGASVGVVWRQQRVRFYRERYTASEALRDSEQNYRTLFENMRNGFAYCRMLYDEQKRPVDFVYLAVNKAFEHLTGLKNVVGKRVSAVLPGIRELSPELFEAYGRVAATGQPESFEFDFKSLQQWLAISVYSPTRGCFVAIFDDITARKRAEAEIQESERRLHFALGTVRTGAWSLNLLDHTAHRTQLHDQIFGYQSPLPEWTYEMFLEHVLPDDRPEVDRKFREATTAQSVWNFECRIRRTDGEVRWIAAAGDHERNATGHPVRMAGVVQDITERKRTEVELQERNAELERFLYTVSHDLKSPVVTVRTFLGYLEQDLAAANAERTQQDLRYIRSAAEKMGRLLDDVLELSRVGRVMGAPVCVTFHALAEETVQAVAGQIAERGVRVQVGTDNLPVFGDRLRLGEIWQNLVENAVKFMGDQAAPRIDLGWEVRGRETVFFVRDNGIGIDPRFQAKVFGLFEKLDPKIAGTGIGLALVKRIVDLYAGRIWVESAGSGQGACFLFTLPEALHIHNEGKST